MLSCVLIIFDHFIINFVIEWYETVHDVHGFGMFKKQKIMNLIFIQILNYDLPGSLEFVDLDFVIFGFLSTIH